MSLQNVTNTYAAFDGDAGAYPFPGVLTSILDALPFPAASVLVSRGRPRD